MRNAGFFFVFSILCACSDAANSTGDSGVPPINLDAALTIETLARSVSAVACDRYRSCPTNDAIDFPLRAPGSPCESLSESVTGGFFAETRELIRLGRVRFNAAKARECFADSLSSCLGGITLVTQARAACDYYEGTVLVNQPCMTSIECVDSTYCKIDSGQCGGTCTAKKDPGQECVDSLECGTGGEDGVAACASQTCVIQQLRTPGLENQPCDVEFTESFVRVTPCATGLYCDSSLPAPVCRRPLAVGEACVRNRVPCVPNAQCMLLPGQSSATCVALVKRNSGETCAGGSFCDISQRLTCGTAGTCATTGDGRTASVCTSDSQCVAGFHCGAAMTCEPAKADGMPCTRSGECSSLVCGGPIAARACAKVRCPSVLTAS